MFTDDEIDTNCYDEDDCRLQACEAKFQVGPSGAIADITNPKWWQFAMPVDLLSLDFNETIASEEYLTVGGGCDQKLKINSRSGTISGELYACKNDIAQCRLCRTGNCVSYCYMPSGDGFTYDVDGSDHDVQDTPPFGDPIGAGEPVRLGRFVITDCSEGVTAGDYIKYTFSGTIVGKTHRFNYCESLQGYDETTIPDDFLDDFQGEPLTNG